MARFIQTYNQYIDANGDPIVGGTVEFYVAGTTTPLTVYSDSALSTALGTSLTTDSRGAIAQCFFSGAAKVVIKDAAGATIRTDDNIDSYETLINESVTAAATSATNAATSASAAAASEALAAAYASGSSNAIPMFPTTAAALGQGVVGHGTITGGSGGTDGTFALAFTGGTQVVAPAGVFTVASGAVTSITITAPGYYSAGTPSFSFAASSGLTGAAASVTMAANRSEGQYFLVPDQVNPSEFADLYTVTSGAAVFVESLASQIAVTNVKARATDLEAQVGTDDGKGALTPRLGAVEAIAATTFDVSGYHYHPLTQTRYQPMLDANGSLTMAYAPHVYLDPEDGNDAWDGSAGYFVSGTIGPKKTRAGVEAHAAMVANAASDAPVTIGIKASSAPWREGFDYYTASTRNGNNTRHYVSLVVYGGPRRELRCTDLITLANFTPHATIANAYEITLPHDMWTTVSYTSIFVDGERKLKQVADEADVAVAGTWWAASGARVTAGVDVRIVIHMTDSSDPRVYAGTMEYSARDLGFGALNNCLVDGIHTFGNGVDSGGIAINNYGVLLRCIGEEGQKHNILQGPGGYAEDCAVINCTRSDDVSPHAARNMWVCYGFNGGGTGFENGLTARLERCAFLCTADHYTLSDGGKGSAFYAHAAGSVGPITFKDCWDSGLTLTTSTESSAATLLDHVSWSDYGTSGAGIMQTVSGNLTVEGGFFFGGSIRPFIVGGAGHTAGARLTIRGIWMASDGYSQHLALSHRRITFEDNLFCTAAGMCILQIDGSVAGNCTIRNNVFIDVYVPYRFITSDPSSLLDIDGNLYVRNTTDSPAQSMAWLNAADYIQNFANWQAAGHDENGSQIDISDTAAVKALFRTNIRPTKAFPVPIPAEGGAIETTLRRIFRHDKYERALSLPRTRAAYMAYHAALPQVPCVLA